MARWYQQWYGDGLLLPPRGSSLQGRAGLPVVIPVWIIEAEDRESVRLHNLKTAAG